MSTDSARQLAEDCLAAAHPRRWKHVQGVAARAVEITQFGDRSENPLVSAAWLHDVGYAEAAHETGLHALDGARYLQSVGASSLVVSLVAYHTGAEFEAEERGLAEQLATIKRPPQEVLDALIQCDLTVSPDGDAVTVADRIDEIDARYPDDDPVHRAVTRSRAYLEACCARAMARVSA